MYQFDMTNNTLLYKTKQFFFVLIKLSIVVGAFYFIYEKLTNNDQLQFSVFIDFLSEKHIFSSKTIVFLLFLSISNWFFEILKWRSLVSFVEKITFKNALEQSLGALTASLFTPNRIGEYGAKAIYYTRSFRKRIMLVNLLSNILQMGVTTILGIIGFCFFITSYAVPIDFDKIWKLFIVGSFIFLALAIVIKKSKVTIKGFSLKKIQGFIISFPRKKLIFGFLFSLLRYAIFSFQFYTLLQLFDVNMSYIHAMVLITSMYLTASVMPSIFIFDVVIKGSLSLYIFSFAGVNALTVLSIITLMWVLNFVLPSMLGSFYVLNFNIPKNED